MTKATLIQTPYVALHASGHDGGWGYKREYKDAPTPASIAAENKHDPSVNAAEFGFKRSINVDGEVFTGPSRSQASFQMHNGAVTSRLGEGPEARYVERSVDVDVVERLFRSVDTGPAHDRGTIATNVGSTAAPLEAFVAGALLRADPLVKSFEYFNARAIELDGEKYVGAPRSQSHRYVIGDLITAEAFLDFHAPFMGDDPTQEPKVAREREILKWNYKIREGDMFVMSPSALRTYDAPDAFATTPDIGDDRTHAFTKFDPKKDVVVSLADIAAAVRQESAKKAFEI